MSALAFFDTNVIVYTDDFSTPDKQKKAIALFSLHRRSNTAVVSVQVLQEYFSAATGKLGLTADVAQQKVEILARARVVRFEAADVIAAIELHRLRRLSFWDSLILHAARIGGAATLYSEDFQHGTTIAGVRVINPFLS